MKVVRGASGGQQSNVFSVRNSRDVRPSASGCAIRLARSLVLKTQCTRLEAWVCEMTEWKWRMPASAVIDGTTRCLFVPSLQDSGSFSRLPSAEAMG